MIQIRIASSLAAAAFFSGRARRSQGDATAAG
jgi:hypothetical protein